MGVLRLLLALFVLIEHGGKIHGFAPLSGLVAVETFFMISGFYMAMILNEKYTGPGSYRLFISNRFLRIYPMYWAILLFAVAVSAFIYIKTGGGPLSAPKAVGLMPNLLLGFSNLLIFGQDLLYFTGTGANGHLIFTTNFHATSPQLWTYQFIPPAWTLSVELVFYLIAPLLVRRRPGVVLAVLVLSAALRGFVNLKLDLHYDPWTYRFFPMELAFFLAGAIGYRVYARIRSSGKIQKLLPLFAGFFFLCLFAYQFLPDRALKGFVIKQWAFYGLAWIGIPLLFMLSRRSKIDRYIGELSYPVYLLHFPMLLFLGMSLHRVHLEQSLTIICILTTLPASMMITWLIAVPLERLRQRRVAAAHLTGGELARNDNKVTVFLAAFTRGRKRAGAGKLAGRASIGASPPGRS